MGPARVFASPSTRRCAATGQKTVLEHDRISRISRRLVPVHPREHPTCAHALAITESPSSSNGRADQAEDRAQPGGSCVDRPATRSEGLREEGADYDDGHDDDVGRRRAVLGGNCQANVDPARALGARGMSPLMPASGKRIVTSARRDHGPGKVRGSATECDWIGGYGRGGAEFVDRAVGRHYRRWRPSMSLSAGPVRAKLWGLCPNRRGARRRPGDRVQAGPRLPHREGASIPHRVRCRRGPPPHSPRSRRARRRREDVYDGARLNARDIAKTLTLVSA